MNRNVSGDIGDNHGYNLWVPTDKTGIGTPILDQVVLIVQCRPGREHNAVHAHVIGNGAGNIITLGGDIAHLHVADNRGFLITRRDIHSTGRNTLIISCSHIGCPHDITVVSGFICGNPQVIAVVVKSPAGQADTAFFANAGIMRCDRLAGTVIHTLEQAHGDIALHAIIHDMSQIAGAGAGSLAHIDILAFTDHAYLIAPVFAVEACQV